MELNEVNESKTNLIGKWLQIINGVYEGQKCQVKEKADKGLIVQLDTKQTVNINYCDLEPIPVKRDSQTQAWKDFVRDREYLWANQKDKNGQSRPASEHQRYKEINNNSKYYLSKLEHKIVFENASKDNMDAIRHLCDSIAAVMDAR